MSKPLNQIELGTSCFVKESGQAGTLQRIFYYPTKYLVKTADGEFQYYSTHEITFEGYDRPKTSLSIPDVPYDGVGSNYAVWVPFQAESQVEHHFLSSKQIVWEMITSLELYNVWFDGIQRAIPDVTSERYVHQFSFDKLPLKPGAYFKIRPATLAPWFRCRIITMEKEKEFGFDFKMNPFYSEYVSFKIEESKNGVFVICNRFSKGPLSFLALINWNKGKSKILQKLAEITPTVELKEDDSSNVLDSSAKEPQLNREQTIAFVVNKSLDGDNDPLNALSDKVTRGKAKAFLVKIKRGSAERPAMPDMSQAASAPAQSNTELTQEHTIALVVNKSLDGDNDPLNAIEDKVTRGKAKALLVKIKRGSAERPSMPDVSSSSQSNPVPVADELSPDKIFAIAVNKGADGDMELVNAIEDRVTRGKAKALLVKIKRGTADRPPMPDSSLSKNTPANDKKSESEDEMIERLVAAGVGGDMEEINALESRVLRGKIKAAIVKEKRKK
ncbi:hypothetical protein HOA87_00915 [bacterium]|jgi:hypothetical protein|nr:hypothetical protein [bacterium]MBT4250309.1 hypothetical protein [bacterium]MBT4927738.1 hypothetical protein [bacterium]MBT5734448.1 hypothetical protein [bacterium]MBT6776525.1 hypothetical protein [bacterium]